MCKPYRRDDHGRTIEGIRVEKRTAEIIAQLETMRIRAIHTTGGYSDGQRFLLNTKGIGLLTHPGLAESGLDDRPDDGPDPRDAVDPEHPWCKGHAAVTCPIQ
jgi:hypothetical protein